MAALRDRLRALFPTSDPAAAATGPSGERLAQQPPPKSRQDGDIVPVVAVLVGVVALAVMFLRPQRLSLASGEPNPETTGDNFASDYPQTEQGY